MNDRYRSGRLLGGAILLLLALLSPRLLAAEQGLPKVLFFGSSTVTGVGASTPEHRWTSILARAMGWEEVNAGLSGSTLTHRRGFEKPQPVVSGVERWREVVGAHDASVILFVYGANDVVQHAPLTGDDPPATFRGALGEVLSGIRQLRPRARLVVLEPQPAPGLVHNRAPYDQALEEAARHVGATFVRTIEAIPPKDLQRTSADGLHLNDSGHAALAAFVERALLEAGLTPAPPAEAGK